MNTSSAPPGELAVGNRVDSRIRSGLRACDGGQHLASAEQVARFLNADPRIAFVEYPGLPSHPQHDLAAVQFKVRGFGAMIAFAIDGDSATQNRFVSNLRVITSAVSLGHDETLIVYVGPEARGGSESYPDTFRTYGHLRISVGLEDAADLIADLRIALDRTEITGAPRTHNAPTGSRRRAVAGGVTSQRPVESRRVR